MMLYGVIFHVLSFFFVIFNTLVAWAIPYRLVMMVDFVVILMTVNIFMWCFMAECNFLMFTINFFEGNTLHPRCGSG